MDERGEIMFTDKEHRILLSAMSREEKICKQVDKESNREPYEQSLQAICYSINRKIHDIQHKYRWHSLLKDPNDLPPNEHEVEIAYIGYDGKPYTARAFHEDGKMHSEDSMMTCLDWCSWSDWCEYCEETDDWIIPECWLEYVSFGETYAEIDKEVIAWRKCETYEEIE